MHTLKMKFLLSATHLPFRFQSLVAFPIKYVYRCMENIVSVLRVKGGSEVPKYTNYQMQIQCNSVPAIRNCKAKHFVFTGATGYHFGPTTGPDFGPTTLESQIKVPLVMRIPQPQIWISVLSCTTVVRIIRKPK